MAKLQVRTDAGALVASVDLPDASLAIAQEFFGGATAAETAAAVLGWLKGWLRMELRRQRELQVTGPGQAQVLQDVEAALQTFDGQFPE